MSGWRDAFDAQMGLWRWLRTPVGRGSMDLRMEDFTVGMNPDSRSLIHSLYSVEEIKLEGADPIFVSGEMCDLIDYARDTDLAEPFMPEPLYVTDLPTLSGFLLYEKPFDVLDRFDNPIQIAAFSWTPLFGHDPGDEPPDYGNEDQLVEWLDNDGAEGRTHGIALTIYVTTNHESYRDRGLVGPPVEITHFTPWYFGMSFDGNEYDAEGKPTGAGWWWRMLQVTFRLMQQKISVQSRSYGPRPQRRQAKRLGFTDREVLVVRLRRERSKPTEDETGPANYSHRFIVSGHWRNQWYPASNDHRQIWISPYVKGDESLPLVVKPRRAFVLNR